MFYLNITITGCTDTDPDSPEQKVFRPYIKKLQNAVEELLAFNDRHGYFITITDDGLVDTRHRGIANAEASLAEQTAEDYLEAEEKTLSDCQCEYCARRRAALSAWRDGQFSAKLAVDLMQEIANDQAEAMFAKTRLDMSQFVQGIVQSIVSKDEAEDAISGDDWRDTAKDMGLE